MRFKQPTEFRYRDDFDGEDGDWGLIEAKIGNRWVPVARMESFEDFLPGFKSRAKPGNTFDVDARDFIDNLGREICKRMGAKG